MTKWSKQQQHQQQKKQSFKLYLIRIALNYSKWMKLVIKRKTIVPFDEQETIVQKNANIYHILIEFQINGNIFE